MTPDSATDLVRNALIVCMIIAGPILLVGLLIGIVISIVQAVTQIQEQSLSLIPKIVAMVAVTVILMPWMCQKMMDYTQSMFTSIMP